MSLTGKNKEARTWTFPNSTTIAMIEKQRLPTEKNNVPEIDTKTTMWIYTIGLTFYLSA